MANKILVRINKYNVTETAVTIFFKLSVFI